VRETARDRLYFADTLVVEVPLRAPMKPGDSDGVPTHVEPEYARPMRTRVR